MGRKPTKNKNLPRGMRAREQRSGNTFYYYDIGGRPRREIPLGSDYVQAVRKWAELEADKGTPHAALITFKYVADRYTCEVIPTKAARTQSDNIIERDKLLEFFSDAPLIDIKPIFVRQYLDWRHTEAKKRAIEENAKRVSDGKTPKAITGQEGKVRANREKALFSHIWNKAREWGLTDAPNPCMGIKGFKESGRDTYIDDETFKAVYDATDDATRDAMDIAYLTGQRPADVLKISLGDLKDGELWLQQNKTGTKLRIAIEGELAIVINRIKARKYKIRTTALIVDEKGRTLTASALRGRFDKAREDAIGKTENADLAKRIKGFQFRDLRAKAGTDKEGTDGMSAAKDLLGHADESMTRNYVRHRVGKLMKPTK
jgi:integrase